jgi:ribosomal-protein-alanine N-acetyltransferase
MRIRRMTIEDLDQIINLEKEIFPDPWSWANFEYEIQKNPYSIPLILDKDGDIWGYAIVWKIYEEFHIANFAIAPSKQGQKHGSNFLKHLFKLSGDCKYAILEVRESNLRAIQMYQKFGFKIIMRREKYYKNGETALIMQKLLNKNQN